MSQGQQTATTWQPDWAALETKADSLIASDPLAALITSVSPAGGYVAIALRARLTDILQAATKGGPLSGPLVIAVDTLVVPAGNTVIPAPAVEITARSIVVEGDAFGELQLATGAAIQVTTGGVTPQPLRVWVDAGEKPAQDALLEPKAVHTPQVWSYAAGGQASSSTDQQDIADGMHEPWSIVALEVSAAIAATLIDEGSDGAIALAADMLSWTVAGCSALLGQQKEFPTVDFGNIASVQSTSVGLFAYTQSLTSGATYAPVLSTSVYQQQIEALLQVARDYDAQITALQGEQNIDQQLAAFAKTLGTTYQEAQAPLLTSLRLLATESGSVQTQLTNAAVQLQEVSATLKPLQEALVDAINEEFQKELAKSALTTFFTVIELYVGAAAVCLGDPQVLAGDETAIIAAAMEIAEKLIKAGEKTIDSAISDGAASAGLPPTPDVSAGTTQGAQYLAGSVASFGQAAAVLWAVVAQASASTPVNLSPDLIKAVDTLPDLGGFSVGGLDPVTYWKAVVVQTTAAVGKIDLPEAAAYLEAVELAATYGSAVGDLQMKLLGLYTQGMTAFGQLQAAYQAEASWQKMQASLTTTADKVAAATGLLQRGYLNVKRSIVLAVQNYRASFLYQWLQPADIEVDVSMDLVTLRQQATKSIDGLQQVLAGAGTGTVRPRQEFQNVTYTVSQRCQPLFSQVNGKGVARFTIPADALASQLNGDTALYLTAATFQLVGGNQDSKAEVELQIATSGHYSNQLGSAQYRFVSRPVSMTNSYYPGNPPRFVTQWQFADKNAYLAPTPYTNWTVTVDKGDWQHATAINITLTGILLQNP